MLTKSDKFTPKDLSDISKNPNKKPALPIPLDQAYLTHDESRNYIYATLKAIKDYAYGKITIKTEEKQRKPDWYLNKATDLGRAISSRRETVRGMTSGSVNPKSSQILSLINQIMTENQKLNKALSGEI